MDEGLPDRAFAAASISNSCNSIASSTTSTNARVFVGVFSTVS